ncbi:hypothetical protein X474_19980 [Dethiosulfatarculus sandiegensis]|uniref:Uncharacterized protein n=1 Tax=Dethiosulfatarculus sandiegensis TaxID=1429043 RepID=A0A0D2J221_9BACT|nr:hypothetical protein X474_19980 [Dethiosulfatarculus sandiegensis]
MYAESAPEKESAGRGDALALFGFFILNNRYKEF